MNCQQFNLVKSNRGIYILEKGVGGGKRRGEKMKVRVRVEREREREAIAR